MLDAAIDFEGVGGYGCLWRRWAGWDRKRRLRRFFRVMDLWGFFNGRGRLDDRAGNRRRCQRGHRGRDWRGRFRGS